MAQADYSTLRAKPRVNLTDASPLPAPMTIYLEPTNVCNFRCVYCPESFPEYKQVTGGFHRLDAAGFAHVADQIAALGKLKMLNFYELGEPFLNRALPDFIAAATERGLADRTCVTTNGSVLDAAMIERVLDSGLSYLRVSVYGATEETVAARTGAKITLAKVRNNVAAFRAARNARGMTTPVLYAKMIETGDPAEDAMFVEMFRPIVDKVALEPVFNWNDPDGKNLALIPLDQMIKHDYFRYRKKVCAFPFYTLVIHADLRVSVCCVDWAKQAVVGDLKTDSLRDIWHGDKLREFRLTHLRGERHTLPACKSCTYLYTAPDTLDELSPETFQARCLSSDHFATP